MDDFTKAEILLGFGLQPTSLVVGDDFVSYFRICPSNNY